MQLPVIIYSPDEIRCKIISKTLRLNNIQVMRFTTVFETKEAVYHHIPSIIILDLKKNLSGETNLIKEFTSAFPHMWCIVLSNVLKSSKRKISHIRFYDADPIDPAYILSVIKKILIYEQKSFVRKSINAAMRFIRFVFASLFLIVPVLLTLIIGIAVGFVLWCLSDLPDIEFLKEYAPYQSSKLYSYDNVILTEFYIERRIFVPVEKIPAYVKKAFISVEDSNFYNHYGIDIKRLINAFFVDIREMDFIQGGSTITQQLAKMLLLKPEKTITRKIKEAALSIQIESKYTKDEILGLYLNQAYFGERAYGIESACQTYFGTSVTELTISEGALLAALLKAPSKYSPFKDREKSLQRRNYALKRMLLQNIITQKEYLDACAISLPKQYHGTKYRVPYFVDYCKTVLDKKVGDRLYTSGLRIYSTLDYRIQQIAEKAIQNGIEDLNKRGIEDVEAALVAVEIKTGAIKAMVGGKNYWEYQYNLVTQAKRQPGSTFKPIVYLTALEHGFSPGDTIEDRKISYSLNYPPYQWAPKNFSDNYRGTVTLTTALALSLNAATVNLATKVKMHNIIHTAEKLGIKSTIYPYYPSALGASEVTLLEMVCAYGAFACGERIEPLCIDVIIDKEQSSLTEKPVVREKILGNSQLANIKKMLRTVITDGTGKKALVINRPVYGKTGTSNDFADAWFIGFDSEIVVGIWVGRIDHKPIGENETGSTAAIPIWIEFMNNISPEIEGQTVKRTDRDKEEPVTQNQKLE